jgi:hypothetical protein
MTAQITIADLEAMGFTREQIERLVELREAYPYIEHFDSAEEWRRLQFLKWRLERRQALVG